MAIPKAVLIDTDPGLDDALALVLALRSSALDVRAITVVAGNVPLATCTANALRILELLRPDPPPPVFEGCADPLSPQVARAVHVHGGDGMGGVSDRYPIGDRTTEDGHAADAMVELARRWGDDLTVITLGPLTNAAVALERDPAAMRSIRQLVVMGGSADGNGNVTPAAEFNFFSDPVAADTVLGSGLPVTVVGLNVTEQARLPRARFEARRHAMPAGPLSAYLGDISSPYFDFCRKESGVDACALHDPLAVAVAISPDLVKCETMACKVVTSQGLARGAMISDRAKSGRRSTRVATAVDAEGFLELFLGVVCAP